MGKSAKGVFPLQGTVQNYAWGGADFISELFQIDNAEQKPMAEYWVGVHPRGMSQIYDQGTWRELNSIAQLPFLLKILDVNQMLSIQSHPNKDQAIIGYQKEEAQGISKDAKHRIFKDDNHKPELMVALSDFWLLHGFKSEGAIKSTFVAIPEFKSFESKLDKGIESLYTHLMQLEADQVKDLLTPLHDRLSSQHITDRDHPDYWAQLAFNDYGFDRGIFSIYLFNLVRLQSGEAIYQEAGIPHAYLEGKNIEIMANSDNVFRAGLTPKHIDVDVLLTHLDFSPVTPQVIKARSVNPNEKVYKSPASEFELRIIDLPEGDYHFQSKYDECFIVLSGQTIVVSDQSVQHYDAGQCFFVASAQDLIFKADTRTEIVRATLPH